MGNPGGLGYTVSAIVEPQGVGYTVSEHSIQSRATLLKSFHSGNGEGYDVDERADQAKYTLFRNRLTLEMGRAIQP